MINTIKISVCLAALATILFLCSADAFADYGFAPSTTSSYGYGTTAKSDYGMTTATVKTNAVSSGSTRTVDPNYRRNTYYCPTCKCVHYKGYHPGARTCSSAGRSEQANQTYQYSTKTGNPQKLYDTFNNR